MVVKFKEQPQRLVLYSIPWKSYDAILHALDGRRLRLTYDRGTLEIMTIGYPHEFYQTILARFIEIVTLEMAISLAAGGSLTFCRETMEKGLEPDECYWIQNASLMTGKLEYDIESDPPPDLAIEIDIFSSSLDRMAIYAALGVREIWRYDGEALFVYHLIGGKYKRKDKSRALPFLPLKDVLRWVKEAELSANQTPVMRSFTTWVRETLIPAPGSKANGKSK
jgi:Uma2 family endonuclease